MHTFKLLLKHWHQVGFSLQINLLEKKKTWNLRNDQTCDFIATSHAIKVTDHLHAMRLVVVRELLKALWNAQVKEIKLDFKITNQITGFSEYSNKEGQFSFFLPLDVF